MGHIAALLSRTGGDVSRTLQRMMEASDGLRGDAYGVATHAGAYISYTTPPWGRLPSEALLGHVSTKISYLDSPQPVHQHGYAVTFEGRIWDAPGKPEFLEAMDTLGPSPAEGVGGLISSVNGAFAVAALEKDKLTLGRDPVGVTPLYVGESPSLVGAASSMKMLWAAGLEATNLPPGHMAELTRGGISFTLVRKINRPNTRVTSMEEAVDQIEGLLRGSVEARSRGLHRAALGFSGGIDSSLLAYFLDRAGVEVELICVGMEGSEFEAAETAANHLDLPLSIEAYTEQDVEGALDRVLWSIEEPDPMKTAVATPLLWTASKAVDLGVRVLFSGNGSDELYGGYMRHLQEYLERGDAVTGSLLRDVRASHAVNYERDQKVCADSGIELRLPYADLPLIEHGLSIPPDLLFPRDPGTPRKRALRALAGRLGFPEEMAGRSKRAIQYSTGVSKALTKIARRDGQRLPEYLSTRFDHIKRERLEGV
jgi:asparagine synthase (glutamine-hydrolysing)